MTPKGFSTRRRVWNATSVVERASGRVEGMSVRRIPWLPGCGLEIGSEGSPTRGFVAPIDCYSRAKGAVEQ